MTRKLRDDCFLHDSDRLTHAEAITILRDRIDTIAEVEDVKLDDAPGRFLAEDVISPRAIPAHTNAAVDGYAFAFSDYDSENGSTFEVSARAAAGHALSDKVQTGTAARIFTGAAMPNGTETVVMQEDTDTQTRDGKIWVSIPGGLKKGANCRLAGEDVEAGETMLARGARLRPQDVASAAAAGRGTLACFRPVKIGVFSTGDEIIRPGEELKDGQVYDANAPMLTGLIETTGAVLADLGVLPDTAEAVQQSLADASSEYDVIITSGGASRGEEDHVIEAMDELGQLAMWQIAIKPGRPMAFGQIGDCVHMGLPGNPVAVFVCFLLYVRPVLIKLGGGEWPEPVRYPLPAAFSVPRKKPDRREFWRAFLTTDKNSNLAAGKFERDGSGLITGLRAANGLIEVSEDVTKVEEGDIVQFIPFSEFGIRGD